MITFPIFRLAFLLNIELLNKHVRFDHDPVQRQEIPPEYLRRLTPLQARLCLLGLDRVDTDIRKRVAFAHRYDDELSTCFKEHYRDCPQARATADDTFLLPTYPRYEDADVARNTSAIREFFGKGRP